MVISALGTRQLFVLELEKKKGILVWVLIGALCVVVAAVLVGLAAYFLAKRTNR